MRFWFGMVELVLLYLLPDAAARCLPCIVTVPLSQSLGLRPTEDGVSWCWFGWWCWCGVADAACGGANRPWAREIPHSDTQRTYGGTSLPGWGWSWMYRSPYSIRHRRREWNRMSETKLIIISTDTKDHTHLSYLKIYNENLVCINRLKEGLYPLLKCQNCIIFVISSAPPPTEPPFIQFIHSFFLFGFIQPTHSFRFTSLSASAAAATATATAIRPGYSQTEWNV